MSIRHQAYPLTLLYDASCPVCRLEMDKLRRLNREGRLVFADISAADFNLATHWPATAPTQQPTVVDMNAALHGIGADSVVYTGVETLRLAYGAVGLGWLWAPTNWPALRPAFDVGYRWLARHRYAISARLAPLIELVERRRARSNPLDAQARMDRMQRCHDAQGDASGQRCDLDL